MTTVETDQLTNTVQGLKEAARTALQNESVDDFEAFERYLSEVEAYVREIQQSMWADGARATIRRLEKGEPLTEPDLDLIRTFLVSDAQAYLKRENNYRDWLCELERLMDDVDSRVRMVTRESIADLRGVLKDAIRLVPDIRNFLDEQRRVERFENAIDSFDQSSRELLLRLLKEQLRSTNR